MHPINGDANSTIEQPGEDDSSHGKASDRVLEAGDSRLLTLREIMAMLGWKEGIFSGMNTYVTMALTTPVPEIRERCKSGWATLGVVSALLAGACKAVRGRGRGAGAGWRVERGSRHAPPTHLRVALMLVLCRWAARAGSGGSPAPYTTQR